MPIEIKELHIKVTINQTPDHQKGKPVGNQVSTGSSTNELLIAECVEQVLQVMKNKYER